MKVVVGTEPVHLPIPADSTPIVQNLGPGVLYLDHDPEVSVDTGLKVPVDTGYEFARDLSQGGGQVYAVADADDTDVRILVVG